MICSTQFPASFTCAFILSWYSSTTWKEIKICGLIIYLVPFLIVFHCTKFSSQFSEGDLSFIYYFTVFVDRSSGFVLSAGDTIHMLSKITLHHSTFFIPLPCLFFLINLITTWITLYLLIFCLFQLICNSKRVRTLFW